MNRHISYTMYEQKLAEFGRQEKRREAQNKLMAQEKQLKDHIKNEEKLQMKIYLRGRDDEEAERRLEEAYMKAEQERMDREKQLEQENLAQEMDRINQEKMRDDKMREYIKKNSLEIRDLEAKLKSAYLNRVRAAQIAEKEELRVEAMKEKADLARKMKSEQEKAATEQERQDQRRYEELIRYQRDLGKQLEEKEKRRQESYEEFLREKLMVDEIVKRIYEEDRMNRELQLQKVVATKHYIDEFKKQQAEWKRLEREKMEEENRRILEYAETEERKKKERLASAKQKDNSKEILYKMLSDKIETEKRTREEMERVRQELYSAEQEEASRQKEIEEMEWRIRQRLELQQTYMEQLAFRMMRRQAEKDEEEDFRRRMLAKFAEDDRIEQMNAQKRRLKQLEHKRAVEKLIEDRKQKLLADKERDEEEQAMLEKREAERRQIVEEERLKLLKFYATKLLGYLPRGIFREDDLKHFDEDFRSNFQPRQTDLVPEEGCEEDEQ